MLSSLSLCGTPLALFSVASMVVCALYLLLCPAHKHRHTIKFSPHTFPHLPLNVSPCPQPWLLGRRHSSQDFWTILCPQPQASWAFLSELSTTASYATCLWWNSSSLKGRPQSSWASLFLSMVPKLSYSRRQECSVQSCALSPVRCQLSVFSLWDDSAFFLFCQCWYDPH